MTQMSSRRDPARLAELRRLLILDTPKEPTYDQLTRQLAQVLDVPMAMVNLLDEERDWFKSVVGLQQTQSAVATSFCEVFLHTDSSYLVVNDTQLDPRFADHPLVLDGPRIRFYAAVRLIVQGQTVGTLCAYDVRPRQVTALQIEELQLLARSALELIVNDAEARRRT